jgi:hypothetical protein
MVEKDHCGVAPPSRAAGATAEASAPVAMAGGLAWRPHEPRVGAVKTAATFNEAAFLHSY